MYEIINDETNVELNKTLKDRENLRALSAELTIACAQFLLMKNAYKEGNNNITITEYSQKFKELRKAEQRLINFAIKAYGTQN